MGKYGLAVAAVKPAKVMVCPGWEPDGHVSTVAKGRHKWGTAKDYVNFRLATKEMFDKGATNAVYIMDFSNKCSIRSEACESFEPLTPKDGSIKWMFFNVFQTYDKEEYNKQVAQGKYFPPYDLFKQVDAMYNYPESRMETWSLDPAGKTHLKDIPWGLGAWGSNNATSAPEPWKLYLARKDRKDFLKDARKAMDSDMRHFPRLRAEIYFDSLYSIITPLDVTIT